MAARSPARFLAPIALIAFAFALVLRRPGRAADDRGRQLRTSQRDRDATATSTSKKKPRRRSKPARPTRSSPATRRPAIAEKTGVSLETLRQLNPELDPQTLVAGPEDQAEQVRRAARRARGARGGARAARRPRRAQAARTPACPDAVGAPSAIVIEVSTGNVACARARRQAPPDRLDHEADDRAAHARERQADATRFTASHYRPAPIESQIGLLPGERMKVSDLMRGLLLESGNDAAVDARRGRLRLAQGVRARDEPPRAAARPRRTPTTRTRSGSTRTGNYSTARDLVTLATVLRTNTFFKKIVDSPSGTLKTGDHPRTFRNRNTLVAPVPVGQRRQDRPHARRGLRARRLGAAATASSSISAVLGTPSEAARDDDTMALLQLGASRASSASAR